MTLLLVAPIVLAQERGSVEWKERETATQKQAFEIAARVPFETPVKGAPYSADIVVESTQTLADGNHISSKSVGHVYRDGDGRTRREQEGALSVVSRIEPIIRTKKMAISIVDPVAGYSYSLNPEEKIAWRTPIGDAALGGNLDLLKRKIEDERAAAAAKERGAQSTDAPSKASAEAIARARSGGPGAERRPIGVAVLPSAPLEHATIDGLAVEGHRNSETIPAGRIGNEQPIVITSEEWRSTDLKVLVLTKHNDPRTGESTYRLANVLRAEPDPSLFIVPSDYTVKDTNIRRNNE